MHRLSLALKPSFSTANSPPSVGFVRSPLNILNTRNRESVTGHVPRPPNQELPRAANMIEHIEHDEHIEHTEHIEYSEHTDHIEYIGPIAHLGTIASVAFAATGATLHQQQDRRATCLREAHRRPHTHRAINFSG